MAGKKWTAEEIETVCRLYPTTDTKEIGQIVGRTDKAVYQIAFKYGCLKNPEYLAEKKRIEALILCESGKANRFKKGQKPWNTGTKGVMKPNSGCFKKGQQPATAKPIGSERRDKDNQILVKTENGYVRKARVIWEKVHGPIPEWFRVILIDKNPDNLTIENMKLGSMADLMKGNSIHRFPSELVKTIKLFHKFKRQLNEKQNQRFEKHSV